MKNLRTDIIRWNNMFPLDRWWRKKYNVPFGSPKHLAISQIDIFFEWYEDVLYDEFEENEIKRKEMAENYANGVWLIDSRLNNKTTLDEDFDNLDFSQFE